MLSRRRAARSRRVASRVRKEARGTMADGAPACECGEPDSDDVMIACSRSHAKCETAKCGGALWFHLHCVGLHEAPAGRWLCLGCEHHADDDPFARENEWGRRGWGARPAEDELGPA